MPKKRIRKYTATLVESHQAALRHTIAQIDHNITFCPPAIAVALDEERSMLQELLEFFEARRDDR